MPVNAGERQEYVAFVKMLVEYGIHPTGINQTLCPLDVVLDIHEDYPREKMQLLSFLLQQGLSITNCVYQKENQTTLLHIATKFATASGKVLKLHTIIITCHCIIIDDPVAMEFLETVCKYYPYDEECVQDANGNTPYNLLIEDSRSVRVCKVLSQYPISSGRKKHREVDLDYMRPQIMPTFSPPLQKVCIILCAHSYVGLKIP